MRINRGTSRPPCGLSAYYPSGLPAYRGGGISPNAANYLSDFVAENYRTGVTSQTFSDQYTITRASKAWDVVDGVLEEYAINTPMLNSKGIGRFEASTNLLTNNDGAFTTYPVRGGDAGDAAVVPISGFSNAIEFDDSPASTAFAYKTYSYAASTDYTFSFYIKMLDGGVPVAATSSSDAAGDFGFIVYGAITAPDFIESLGGGLYRVSATENSGASSTLNFGAVKYTGNSSRGFIVLGYQLEQKTFASPIIITGASAYTRTAETVVNNAAITSWYNDSEGTVLVRSNTYGVAGDAVAAQFDDGTANNRHVIKYDLTADPDEIDAQTFNGGVSQALISLSSAGVAEGNRTAYAYKASDFAAATDGTQTGTDVSGAVPSIDTLRIGQDSAGNYLGGYIQKIEYYPRRLSQAELEAITALPPAPSNVFEFGADDTLIGSLLPGATALQLLTPTEIRTTVAASSKNEAQTAANQTVPPSTGVLVIPASHTGIVGYELGVTLPDLSVTTFDGTVFVFLSITDQNGLQFNPRVWWNNTLNRWEVGDLSANNITLGVGGSYRISVDNNYSNGEITIKESASTLVYTSATTPTAESFPIIQTQQTIIDAGTGLGLEITAELIQDSADFTVTHVASSVALADALEVKA